MSKENLKKGFVMDREAHQGKNEWKKNYTTHLLAIATVIAWGLLVSSFYFVFIKIF